MAGMFVNAVIPSLVCRGAEMTLDEHIEAICFKLAEPEERRQEALKFLLRRLDRLAQMLTCGSNPGAEDMLHDLRVEYFKDAYK